MSPRDALITFAVPLAISLIVMLMARRAWAGPVALAAGFCGVMPTVLGRVPRLWPTASPDVVFYIAIFVALIAVAGVRLAPPWWLRSISVWLVFALAAILVLLRPLRHSGVTAEPIVLLIIAPAVAWLWWYIFDRPGDGADRWASPLAMCILVAFTSVVLGMSHSVTYGRLGLALAGALGPVAAIAILFRQDIKSASTIAVVGIVASLLLAGRLYTDLTVLSASLIAVAPVVFWRAQDIVPRHWPPARRATISLILLLLPLAAAVGLLLPAFIRDYQQMFGGYGY
jgi:hypothetical protein